MKLSAAVSSLHLFSCAALACSLSCASRVGDHGSQHTPGCADPKGSPTDLHIGPPGEGIAVSPPVKCGSEFYIQVWTAGRRQLGSGPEARQRGACQVLTDADFSQPLDTPVTCPLVHADFIASQAMKSLEARKILTGYGMGACSKPGPSEGDYKISVIVFDWKHADAAVGALLEQMMKWSIFGSLGVSVKQLCEVVPLHERGH